MNQSLVDVELDVYVVIEVHQLEIASGIKVFFYKIIGQSALTDEWT